MGEGKEHLEEVRLLGGWASPYTIRARMALHLKGVEYEFLEQPFGPSKSDLLLSSNPVYKKIPVLIAGGGARRRTVCESMIIVQYVDEARPAAPGAPAILPGDPYGRAVHRFWAAYIDDKFWPALDAISLAQTEEARAKATEETLEALQLLEEAFKSCSNGEAFFGGGAVGLLDVALGCFLPALAACEQLNGVELLGAATTPLLKTWSQKLAAVAAAKAVFPETAKMVEFTKFIQEKFRARHRDPSLS